MIKKFCFFLDIEKELLSLCNTPPPLRPKRKENSHPKRLAQHSETLLIIIIIILKGCMKPLRKINSDSKPTMIKDPSVWF